MIWRLALASRAQDPVPLTPMLLTHWLEQGGGIPARRSRCTSEIFLGPLDLAPRLPVVGPQVNDVLEHEPDAGGQLVGDREHAQDAHVCVDVLLRLGVSIS